MTHTDVCIPFDDVTGVGAVIALPEDARALIIFAHGSGSSRKSPRNAFVAAFLHGHKLGTVELTSVGVDVYRRSFPVKKCRPEGRPIHQREMCGSSVM